MTNTDTKTIPLDLIDVPTDRARDFDAANAEALAAIIAAQGLMHPIRVRVTGDRYTLVAGLHRLEAMRLNGAEAIVATISTAADANEARLEEVMENLGRGELIALDRCHHLYDLKRAYEYLHPDTVAGVAGGKARQGSASEIFSFAEATAEKIGLSKRAIQIAVKIYTDLTADAVMRLRGTDLARKQTELKALSEQKPHIQRRILDLILGDEHPDVQNVASALFIIEEGVKPTSVEKMVRTIRNGLKELPDVSFDLLVAENEDRIMASLKRRGRL